MNPQSTIESQGPYNVKRLTLQVELERFNPATGKVIPPAMSDPLLITESEFHMSIYELLQSKGLTPENFKSVQEPS